MLQEPKRLENGLMQQDSENKKKYNVLKDILETLAIHLIVLGVVFYLKNNGLRGFFHYFISELTIIVFWGTYIVLQVLRFFYLKYKSNKK